MWEEPGMEGVGGARDGGCGRGQGWLLQLSFLGGIPGFHNLYINP